MKIGFQNNDWSVMESGDFRNVKLLKPEDFLARNGTLYRLPYGASSDLASTPKAVWGAPLFLIPCGWYAHAAFGHDCGYQNTLLIVLPDGSTVKARLSKAECDSLLLEMMQSLKPEPTSFETLQMNAIYDGVALGGWHAFKEDRS